MLESQSRDTYENAVYCAGMLRPKPGERWLLVTSAFHMPRAVGVFRKAGFDVTAYPVDYQTTGTIELASLSDRLPSGLIGVDVVVREWAGLIAYWATGRMDELMP